MILRNKVEPILSMSGWEVGWLKEGPAIFGEGKASSKDKLSLIFSDVRERSGRKLSLLDNSISLRNKNSIQLRNN